MSADLKRRALTATLMAGSLLCDVYALAQDRSLEYAVKANYLYKLAPFVQWPATAFESPSSPITLCISGRDPFANLIDDIVKNVEIGQHKFVVRRLSAVTKDSGCHILFAGGPNRGVQKILQTIKGAPILTVTEFDAGTEGAGIINFVTTQERVRFEVDNSAAAENQLQLSAKLLALALAVHAPRAEERK